MENISRICELLQLKRDVFLNVEALTVKMQDAPADDLTQLFEQRGETLRQVTEMDEQIKALSHDNKTLRDALSNNCEPSGLNSELSAVYRASLDVKAVANRILNMEPAVRLHIEEERDKLLERLEEMNSSGNSVARSYQRSVQTGFPQNTIGNSNKSI